MHQRMEQIAYIKIQKCAEIIHRNPCTLATNNNAAIQLTGAKIASSMELGLDYCIRDMPRLVKVFDATMRERKKNIRTTFNCANECARRERLGTVGLESERQRIQEDKYKAHA